jgi:FixJ family two-component response regulator
MERPGTFDTARQPTADHADCLVFVIDDEPSVRKSMSRLLASAGYRSETFGSAEEFLARQWYEGVACMVLDVRMPGLTGTELQDLLASAGHSLPTILISGDNTLDRDTTIAKNGVVGILMKPFDDNDFLRAVTHGLEGASSIKNKLL